MKRIIGLIVIMLALVLSAAQDPAKARSEWMRGYVKMESADKAFSGKKGSEALGLYREALEIFEQVRRRYPNWNQSLLNYRINYCKGQMEKLSGTVGAESQAMQKDELVQLTREQYATITRINEERKSLQSKVEVLSESLERARGEAARNAGVETGWVDTMKANEELKEKLRVQELKVRELQRENERLKGQEGMSEELQKVRKDLKLAVAQLENSQMQLTEARAATENLTRQLRQQKLATDELSRARRDQEMALNVVRELSTARKRENEQLQARYAKLVKRLEDMDLAMEKKEEERKRLVMRAKMLEGELDGLRSLQTAEAEKKRKAQAEELQSLRHSVEQMVANGADGGTGGAQVQRRMLEDLSRQLSAGDREMAKLAKQMAALFADRERMMAQEEELAGLRKQLAEGREEMQKQRAAALTSQENLMAQKGEFERTRGQLAAAEKRCRELLAEMTEMRQAQQARMAEKGLSAKEMEVLQEKLTAAQGQAEQLKQRLDEQLTLSRKQEEAARELQEQLEEKKKAEAKAQEARAEEQKTLTVAKTELEVERRRGMLREQQNSELQKRLKQTEDSLKEAQKARAEQEGKVKGLETGMAELQKAYDEQKAKAAETAKQAAEALAAPQKATDVASIEKLETEVNERNSEMGRRGQALQDLQKQSDEQAAKLSAAEQTIRELRGQLAASKATADSLQEAADKRIEELKAAAQKRLELDGQVTELKATTAALEADKATMALKAGAVDGMTKVVVTAEETREKAEQENRRLRQQAEVSEGQLREAEGKVRDLQKLVDDFRQGGDAVLNREIETLKGRLAKAENRVKALEGALSDGEGGGLGGLAPKETTQASRENEALTKMNEALKRQNRLLTEQNASYSERLAIADKARLGSGAVAEQPATAAKPLSAEAEAAARLRAESRSRELEAQVEVLKAELSVEKAHRGGGAEGAPQLAGESEVGKERQRRERERAALVQGYVRQGVDAERQGKIEAARWNYGMVLEMDPSNKTALQRMGQLAYQEGDDPTAIRYLKQAFYHDPDDPKTLFALGYSYARQSQADWAVATMGRAVSLNPDNAVYARVYGATLLQLGWVEAAEREFRRALKLNPEEKDAAFNLATILCAKSAQEGRGLKVEHLEKLRQKVAGVLSGGKDGEAAGGVQAMLNWLAYYVKRPSEYQKEARSWYEQALKLGMEPDPALEKVLK